MKSFQAKFIAAKSIDDKAIFINEGLVQQVKAIQRQEEKISGCMVVPN
ncbi:hypothetical protein [Edaphocola flava]|nr:hypothetical protein [Edaphocola flava]